MQNPPPGGATRAEGTTRGHHQGAPPGGTVFKEKIKLVTKTKQESISMSSPCISSIWAEVRGRRGRGQRVRGRMGSEVSPATSSTSASRSPNENWTHRFQVPFHRGGGVDIFM
ncbi:hypothetical protein NL108_015322 [Boleophthalmus pectinirostris]|nr:hypothetical protein NL108_015322 [Boleophthalmus pectinirostris]